MAMARIAVARLTNDSIASERSPIEPVTAHAETLSAIVATAAHAEAHAKRGSMRAASGAGGAARRPGTAWGVWDRVIIACGFRRRDERGADAERRECRGSRAQRSSAGSVSAAGGRRAQ